MRVVGRKAGGAVRLLDGRAAVSDVGVQQASGGGGVSRARLPARGDRKASRRTHGRRGTLRVVASPRAASQTCGHAFHAGQSSSIVTSV
jgi:hypothetical protein